MKKNNYKFAIIISLLVISGILSWTTHLREYNQQDTVSIHTFPNEINGWTAEELPISDDEYAILETRNAFTRRYTGPKGQEVYMFVVYSQYNRKVSHPPEVCYTGSGVDVLGNVIDTINVPEKNVTINAHRLELEHHRYKQIAYYWFKVGDSFTPSYWVQQLKIAFKNLIGKPEGSALIRISATVHKGDEQAASAIKEFIQLIVPKLYIHLP